MKVLLVTQAFPPFNASGCVRVGKLAAYLLAQGHDLRVLTASPLPYPRTLPVEIAPERVIYASSFDPFAALAWMRRRQRRRGGTQERSLVGGGSMGRMLRFVGAFAIPEAQVGWYAPAVSAGRRLFRTWRPDAIYASALPFTAHLVARRLARMAGVPWVAEFRDHFAGNPYSNLPGWRGPIDAWMERRAVASASACVTVSEPMAETLRARHGKPALAVLNGFDARDQPAAQAAASDGPLRILYTGLIYPGRRDPSALFAAIASLGARAADVEVSFYGQSSAGVAALARQHGVSAQVHVHEPIPYADSLAAQGEADILLLLLGGDPREAGVFTGKVFEYIGAGRPILAVGSEAGAAADLVRSRGLGVVATRSDAIAGALGRWIDEKRAAGRVAGPPASAKRGLSRGEQFAAVETLLHDVRRAAAGDHLVTAS